MTFPGRAGHGRIRALAASAAILTAAVLGAGCGSTVDGTALPVGGGETVDTAQIDKLLRECDVVTDQQIIDALGGNTYIRDSFFGAVCMWDIGGGSGMLTLNWYENGSLRNEQETNDKLGYITTKTTVQGTIALEIRRPDDPNSCGMTASAADSGVIGWWVNSSPGATADPCAAAKKLLELTLNIAR
ncbi:DUF3558 domain-containing protein [Nocardia flavorosea]|uniref:DUF3558 domain-containing protein n=1 Tax=Nocardia flavorosea TaxID=53429 RepID=UPI001893E1DB|nr:DUF3558 domain-containing protein [Nocardia flavorosea]MBF6352716.1 DUF3558 domain-containing protein [Nocardia flavorosea]